MTEIHLAPLQGFTDTIFRRLFDYYYGGVDYCYTPFIRIERGEIRQRDLKELDADELANLVPQILPGTADEVHRLVDAVEQRGYNRIDVNMGCPFPPIAAHGKGCVLFNYPQRMREILAAMAEHGDIEFSLKIRLGFTSSDQWKDVIDDINNTPLRHVTVHARYGKQQYKGECDMAAFGEFVQASKNKVIYNGDIKTVEQARAIIEEYPSIAGLMLGRGLLSNLSLANEIKGKSSSDTNQFRRFHAELVDAHSQHMCGDRQMLGKLQPYWEYFYQQAPHRNLKNIVKAKNLDVYLSSVSALLHAIDYPSVQNNE